MVLNGTTFRSSWRELFYAPIILLGSRVDMQIPNCAPTLRRPVSDQDTSRATVPHKHVNKQNLLRFLRVPQEARHRSWPLADQVNSVRIAVNPATLSGWNAARNQNACQHPRRQLFTGRHTQHRTATGDRIRTGSCAKRLNSTHNLSRRSATRLLG